MQAVLAVQADVAAFEAGEFGAAERPGEPEEQQRRVAALLDIVGPPLALGASGIDDVPDVGDEKWCTWVRG